jgi:hypothetical protein
MWTGRRATRLRLVGSALLSVACQPQPDSTVARDTPAVAWWLGTTFTPTSTTVRGMDVRAIDARWRRADVLDTLALRRRVSQADVREFLASPLSFSLSADLDQDGVAEEFFVGVFEAADGRKGRFIAVTRGGRPVQHFAEEGAPGFSALLRGEREVRWYKCMECDDFESIKWTGSSYALE